MPLPATVQAPLLSAAEPEYTGPAISWSLHPIGRPMMTFWNVATADGALYSEVTAKPAKGLAFSVTLAVPTCVQFAPSGDSQPVNVVPLWTSLSHSGCPADGGAASCVMLEWLVGPFA